MTDREADDLRSLGIFQTALPPPPPSANLLRSMQEIRPVRTRIPLRTLVVVAAAACVFPVAAIALYPLRRDLTALPPIWVAGVALVWFAGFIFPLMAALLPAPGQVLPDGVRAGRTAFLAALTLVLVGLLFTVDVPGVTILPKTTWAGFAHLWWHCVSFSLKVTIPAVGVAAVVLRNVVAARLSRLGAAVGAAAGALSGLTLHGLCPYGGAPHVGLAHGGGVVIGALIGALWLPLLVRVGKRDPKA
ncbi:MAG TPA: NrsF family protein [Polyangia bacterium]|nr:NrsF family protein [Polyangia bacterium]